MIVQGALAHLAPDEHGAEHHLQAVEEVLADDDDRGPAARPALRGADGLDAGRGYRQGRVESYQREQHSQ